MTPAERLAYRAYVTAAAVARALPDAAAEPAAVVTGRILERAMRGRRDMVARHLQRVYGRPLHGAELDRAVTRAFDSYARYWVESFRLPRMTRDQLDARFAVDGYEHIEAARAAGGGAILAAAHLGNWDLAGAWIASRGVPLTAVAEPLDPPELFAWFVEQRHRAGLQIVPLGPGATTALVRALKDNHLVALLCDRDIGGSGVEVTFFGEVTTLPGGPATLALRTGAPLFPIGVYSDAGGRSHAVVRPPIDATRSAGIREDVRRVTQLVAHELEALIRPAPEQWHLFQPNWPSDREAR